MQNFRALGAPPPDPRASGGWGLCPQTPSLRQLGASPPDPPNSPPIANFWLRACANVCIFTQVGWIECYYSFLASLSVTLLLRDVPKQVFLVK